MFGEVDKNRLILIMAFLFIIVDYSFNLGVTAFLGDFLVVFLVIGILMGVLFNSKRKGSAI